MFQNKTRFFSYKLTFLIVGIVLQTSTVFGASLYDPDLNWRTIESQRFDVHYADDPGFRNMAIRISRIAEESLDQVAEFTGFMPDGRIDIVLSDYIDGANGSATVLPRNTLRLFLTAPTENKGRIS